MRVRHVTAEVEIDSEGIRAVLAAVDLEGVIEPLLPDSPDRPAKWLAADIAQAIRTKAV